jgi:hypothetical protein
VLKKVEHRVAKKGSSSHALLAGVDETAIKEESNTEGKSGDDQRSEDNPMEGCVPLPGVDEADIKDDINVQSDVKDEVDIDESVAKDGFSSHALLAGVDETAIKDEADIKDDIKVESDFNDESKQEKKELVSRKDGALTPGVVCEDLEPEERYALTHEEAREDPESEVRNPRDDVKSGSKLYASANHIESHKAEALKDKATVATGRVPILSASVKKPDKKNWKTNSTSQFEATLNLGKGAGNHIECHKVEALKDLSKARTAT